MQVVKKEHVKVMRNQAQYERQIQQLKNEVVEMKKTKVGIHFTFQTIFCPHFVVFSVISFKKF